MIDYEKKYNEALSTAKKLYNEAKSNEYTSDMEDYERIFPELRESEDERIRKIIVLALIASEAELSAFYSTHNITRKECTDWLEKQKDINCLACEQHLKGYIAGRKVTEEEKQKPALRRMGCNPS